THDGVDLKLALGTPLGAIAGGRVYAIRNDDILGKHVLLEHRTKDGDRYLSIYGHLGSVAVSVGQDLTPGQTIGVVGMTGNTSGPHLHLGVHKLGNEEDVSEYTASESINPMGFMAEFRGGE